MLYDFRLLFKHIINIRHWICVSVDNLCICFEKIVGRWLQGAKILVCTSSLKLSNRVAGKGVNVPLPGPTTALKIPCFRLNYGAHLHRIPHLFSGRE